MSPLTFLISPSISGLLKLGAATYRLIRNPEAQLKLSLEVQNYWYTARVVHIFAQVYTIIDSQENHRIQTLNAAFMIEFCMQCHNYSAILSCASTSCIQTFSLPPCNKEKSSILFPLGANSRSLKRVQDCVTAQLLLSP